MFLLSKKHYLSGKNSARFAATQVYARNVGNKQFEIRDRKHDIMKHNIFMAKRIREVLLDGTWIANTNFQDQISRVTWLEATQKVENLNTIAALTFHINYYLAGINQAFDNGKLEIKDKYSFDAPIIACEKDWNKLKVDFLANAGDFASRIEKMESGKFNEPFMEPKYGTYLRNIEGVIEHSYYHLGQVSLIRKLIQRI